MNKKQRKVVKTEILRNEDYRKAPKLIRKYRDKLKSIVTNSDLIKYKGKYIKNDKAIIG